MLASSTHDTKRSEDVRMRINVLSEIPDEWESRINEWAQMNQRFKTAIGGVLEPRRNTEYFIYQTLIGAWPDEPMQEPALTAFYERIWQYVLKSVREAKIYTSWFKPEIEYEDAVNRFIKGIICSGSANDFLRSFLPFQEKISFWGKLNSLSATLIKIASSGVVDIYQGNEILCYNLVDPDNRRPVDFDFRMSLLGQMKSDREQNNPGNLCSQGFLLENISSLKLFYTWGGLRFRRQYKELFVGGEYLPVEIRGKRDKNVVSFIRKYGDKIALLVAGRFFSQWPLGNVSDLGQDFWGNTELVWPKDVAFPEKLKDVVTGEIIDTSKYKQISVIGIADILQRSCGCLFTNI
jgi:(1->4)-alpha-D-glucan 1-alpha-D-glucosylmutase